MSEDIKFFNTYGYRVDRENRLREIAKSEKSLAAEAANQIRHLKQALRDLVCIVEIHSAATDNDFAWAELSEARAALNVCNNTSAEAFAKLSE